ncbi:uncharacterized protein LOC126379511 [Pectinophora gossypiella]|uniref:uncharacterized protein LOC126379511 n=1 Tax=Pectinophora gossypiella TaxID=13191 RepID=UPI00214E54E1|nr:uncharacterized protein LOC126379511 [Pectinophora gossypiella]
MDAPAEASGSGNEQDLMAGVRLVVLNLPEDEGEGLGFRLTRTLWDPYPWVREVVPNSRADSAGLKTGDCLLQADGRDLLGLPVGQVAGLIRGDGAGRGVSLLVWNCGVDPKDDPELLWSCGGGSRGEKSRRALAGVVKALSCCVCAATATRALNCARSHLYCEACWRRLERCALCREPLPAKDSPYARNLVAEQVFEAIATEYEIRETVRRPTETNSNSPSPSRSPNMSPATSRRGQYQLSMMNKYKKTVQFNDKLGQNYASDPNIHRSSINQEFIRRTPSVTVNSTNSAAIQQTGNTDCGGKSCICNCQNQNAKANVQTTNIPKIKIEDTDKGKCKNDVSKTNCCQNTIQHKLVARLRHACSLADLQNAVQQCPCPTTRSLNNVNISDHCCTKNLHSSSLDNLNQNCNSACESPPVFVLSAPPIYVLACDHNKE